MRRPLCLSALLAGGLFIGIPGSAAQDAKSDYAFVKGVQPGEYQDLNVWRTLKLGTAPFVNPELAKRAATAYKYDIRNIDDGTKAKIEDLIKQGEIGVGREVGKNVIVSNDPQQIEDALKRNEPGTVFVTSKPTNELGDGDAIVTWGAETGAIEQ